MVFDNSILRFCSILLCFVERLNCAMVSLLCFIGGVVGQSNVKGYNTIKQKGLAHICSSVWQVTEVLAATQPFEIMSPAHALPFIVVLFTQHQTLSIVSFSTECLKCLYTSEPF